MDAVERSGGLRSTHDETSGGALPGASVRHAASLPAEVWKLVFELSTLDDLTKWAVISKGWRDVMQPQLFDMKVARIAASYAHEHMVHWPDPPPDQMPGTSPTLERALSPDQPRALLYEATRRMALAKTPGFTAGGRAITLWPEPLRDHAVERWGHEILDRGGDARDEIDFLLQHESGFNVTGGYMRLADIGKPKRRQIDFESLREPPPDPTIKTIADLRTFLVECAGTAALRETCREGAQTSLARTREPPYLALSLRALAHVCHRLLPPGSDRSDVMEARSQLLEDVGAAALKRCKGPDRDKVLDDVNRFLAADSGATAA